MTAIAGKYNLVQVTTQLQLSGEGWNEFVTAYNLKEKDTLIFKYKNNACFKVSTFDAQSCGVEKESSYFVKKYVLPRSDHNDGNSQEKIANSRKETSPHDSNVLIERNEGSDQNPTRVDTREPVFEYMSIEVNEDLDEEVEILNPKRKIDDPVWTPGKRPRGELRDVWGTTRHEESIGPLESIRKPITEPLEWPRSVMKARQGALIHDKTPKHEIPSRKREPTYGEKDRARKLASQGLTEESFYIILSSSHVSKTFRLALPKAWTDKYMSPSHQDVILRLNGREWRARYNFDKKRVVGQFISGWIHFARDNALHEFDACVFTLAGRKDGKVSLDVKIIRVIDEEENDEFPSDCKSGQDTQQRGALRMMQL
ncbi:B3 domain-containing protein REM16-like [Chenopodium quinoa]|uniref:B3 domain-containing protein REM16-like n=1 Tax=Chenopodium quinoa TaxID=63459 RepID=UPI000B791330|nr:B3 domain-containing protein REM16-like [Chenopodium quinoa]